MTRQLSVANFASTLLAEAVNILIAYNDYCAIYLVKCFVTGLSIP